jgi:molecular chaperone GrpE
MGLSTVWWEVTMNDSPEQENLEEVMNDEQAQVINEPELSGGNGDELAKLRAEVQSNLDGWQRSRAEFANYKRRTQQEIAESKQRGALEALSKIVPILDDFERALSSVPEELKNHAWTNGTSLILKNMKKVLDEYAVEIIDPVGQEFDPNFHEALGTEDSSEYESGIVTTTLQKGYKSGDKVLRPALVKVAS